MNHTDNNYPRVPFRSISRKCFAWAPRKTWSELRSEAAQAAQIAAMLPSDRAACVASFTAALELAPMADDWPTVAAARAEIMAELKALGAL